jgi:hypothetical protein
LVRIILTSPLELMCSVKSERKMDKIEVLETFMGARDSEVGYATSRKASRSIPVEVTGFFN